MASWLIPMYMSYEYLYGANNGSFVAQRADERYAVRMTQYMQ